MQNLYRQLVNWFPTGTAEGERALLDKVFIYSTQFQSVLDPPLGSPHLLVGTKGSGKSAIVDFAVRLLAQQDTPSVYLTPSDIVTDDIPDSASTGDLSRRFQTILMAAIAAKLSEKSTGWFDGDRATLYREAVNRETRAPDYATRMGKFIAEVAKPLIKVDLNVAFPHLTKSTKDEVESAILKVIGDERFYIFIDDTDQIASPDKANHLNRIWALILAVRDLASKIPSLRCVVTLRAEVWERLRYDPSGQRDQTDHFRSLCVFLENDRAHVAKIVRRRLELAAKALASTKEAYLTFFEGVSARAPLSPDFRSWEDLITIRSRNRPRDAIQLINRLAKEADRDPRKPIRIDEEVFKAVIPPFSQEVALEFSKEVSSECPQMADIIRSFAAVQFDEGSFTMSAEAVRSHLMSLATSFGIRIHGVSIRPENEESVFQLWAYLFTSGFLNARVSDDRMTAGYRHLDALDNRDFVSKARWNDMQSVTWEVNTAYRDWLIKEQGNLRHKFGLARKKSRQRKTK